MVVEAGTMDATYVKECSNVLSQTVSETDHGSDGVGTGSEMDVVP